MNQEPDAAANRLQATRSRPVSLRAAHRLHSVVARYVIVHAPSTHQWRSFSSAGSPIAKPAISNAQVPTRRTRQDHTLRRRDNAPALPAPGAVASGVSELAGT